MQPLASIIEGAFWTADPRAPRAASVGVDSSGLVAAVESDPQQLPRAFPNAPRLRLPPGTLAVPAFHDAHNHWGFAAFDHAEFLGGVTSDPRLCERLGRRSEIERDGWIIGWGWNTNLVPLLLQTDLDRVSLGRPVAVFDKSTHLVQLNAAAVREIQQPLASAVRQGHPGTLHGGRLLESSFLVFGSMQVSPAGLRQSLLDLERRYLSLGIASVDDLDVLSPQVLEALQSMYLENRLTLPCDGYIDFGRFRGADVPEPKAHGAFRIVGMKSYLDGAFGARSALMNQPFNGDGGTGVRLLDEERFEPRWRSAEERGYRRIALHAIGDRAGADAARFLAALAEKKNFDRLRIEHFQLASDEDRKRCAGAGIAVCMQPNFTSDVADYADRLGDRAMKLCEHRSVLDAGALLGFGSDGMPTGPLHGIRCALEHPNPAERLSIEQALRAYTIDACRISMTDSRRGAIAVGKEANIAVLSSDVVAKERIDDGDEVSASIVRGEVRFVSASMRGQFAWGPPSPPPCGTA